MALQQDPTAPPEIEKGAVPAGLNAAAANVIMQLSKLPVGRGVAESKVDSGRLDKHPIKRLRTTLGYLGIALFGPPEARDLMRQEVNHSHRPAHSDPDDDVQYDAFDPELQLWVAACLYKGLLDVYHDTWGELAPDRADAVYEYCAHLGTTLQVRPEMWPANRELFQKYWDENVAEIEMDEVTRAYLQDFARGRFLGPISYVVGPMMELMAVGYLPPEFRDQLELPWNSRRQAIFNAVVKVSTTVSRVLPPPLRHFPFNVYAADTRRRLRKGKPFV